MGSLDAVRLSALIKLSLGRPEIAVTLVDGPVALSHPDLAAVSIRELSGKQKGAYSLADSGRAGTAS
jgi:hypothetical protein